jgi:hypothetical protein
MGGPAYKPNPAYPAYVWVYIAMEPVYGFMVSFKTASLVTDRPAVDRR